ncbi:helix-turn-helix transcriptional regulator [Frankia sp. Cr1]|uniref:helix-turn-helix transcriptional regulator n=1 Tax=Frankia sp. Cr1 TaxID=3073931 RepID=UPI002AD451B7|nr:helix-turn-helix transcriptional regulator [Frankia sp. Cr1]
MAVRPRGVELLPSTGEASGLSVRELAARYGVAPSTVSNAILRGTRASRPAPDPLYINPATGARHYHPAAFDRWWQDRPASRWPRPQNPGYLHTRRRVVDVLGDLDDWQSAES